MQDAEVLVDSRKRLLDTGYHDLRLVRVSIEKETEPVTKKFVVLRGTVCSFFMKQKAQAALMDGINGYEVRNLLEVVSRNLK